LTWKTEPTLCFVGTITAEELREHEEEEEEEECDDTGPDGLDIGGRFFEGAQESVAGVASIFPLPVAVDGVVLYFKMSARRKNRNFVSSTSVL
jgi:hypothetical protein